MDECFPNLCLVLYANDMEQFAAMVGRLQVMIDQLKHLACKLI
jgi:hypothetical protein